MTKDVPYLPDTDIEVEAYALLESFETKYGKIQSLHTPLDEIVENHLGLVCAIGHFSYSSILGQLDVTNNIITINAELDPYYDPRKEGRYNFTLAHECGHSVLHRPYAEEILKQDTLFSAEEGTIIRCFEGDQTKRLERQADKFGSYLIMPRDKVIREFTALTKHNCVETGMLAGGIRRDRGLMDMCFPKGSYLPTDEEILCHFFAVFAEDFKVSAQAMVIRLKELGLLYEASTYVPTQMGFTFS